MVLSACTGTTFADKSKDTLKVNETVEKVVNEDEYANAALLESIAEEHEDKYKDTKVYAGYVSDVTAHFFQNEITPSEYKGFLMDNSTEVYADQLGKQNEGLFSYVQQELTSDEYEIYDWKLLQYNKISNHIYTYYWFIKDKELEEYVYAIEVSSSDDYKLNDLYEVRDEEELNNIMANNEIYKQIEKEIEK